MIALVLLGCLALSSAAPRYSYDPPDGFPDDGSLGRYLEEQTFNAIRILEKLKRDMLERDTMLVKSLRYFPSIISSEKIEFNEYIIMIPLINYEEKEIVVKAWKGVSMVQAVHQVAGEPQRYYFDDRPLPDCVKETFSWSFKNGVLKIVFLIEKKHIAEGEVPTDAPATEAPQYSREDMKPTSDENANRNADI